MATNTYKCGVCKREIETLENKYGLGIVAKCIITKGCVGKLHRTKRNPDNLRESFPQFDSRFDNYSQRRTFHNHIQGTSSNDWLVTHDLGVLPSVSVFELNVDGTYTELSPSTYTITPLDQNSISIQLDRHVVGVAQSVARSSVNVRPTLVDAEEDLFQVTVGGTFVFAVPKFLTVSGTGSPLDLNGYIGAVRVQPRIEVFLQKPNEEEITCFERLPYEETSSPWAGWDEILLRKRRAFYIKTKNILNFTTFSDSELKFTDIPEGTRLRFGAIDYGDGVVHEAIEGESLLLLLSQSPYTVTDKVKNRLVDVGDMAASLDAYLVYKGGEFYINQKFIERTYPLIEKARVNPPTPSLTAVTPTPTPSVTPTPSG